MIDFANELRKAYNGDAWHSNNLSVIISPVNVKYDQAFRRPIPNAHTIGELVLHLTVWTEDVISRLMDNITKKTEKGDWPILHEKTLSVWDNSLSDFHLANDKLLNLSMTLVADQWQENVNYAKGAKIAKWELLNGLLQHHAYHGGQISLLLKFHL
jgi:uncharacterized damage-inducible protein DinB